MAFKRDNEINKEQLATFLQAAVQKVKTEEDVEVLAEFKKIFKKNVPFTLRGYVAAYLLKIATGYARRPYLGKRDFNNSRRQDYRSDYHRTESASPATAAEYQAEEPRVHTPHPHVQIDPSVAATIFVGIGRNRRVYPRDLVGLLVSVGGLDRDRIGDIRVLANYSFIQLFAEDADKAINSLNGYDYRGRKLSVSYSRQRIDETAEDDSGFQAQNEVSQEEIIDREAYAAAEKAATNEAFSSPASSSGNSYLV